VQVDNPRAALDKFGISLVETKREDEFECLCPFHADQHPSCHVNLVKQVFTCKACDARGDLVHLITGKLKVSRTAVLRLLGHEATREGVVEPDKVEAWVKSLAGNKRMLETLEARKGITADTAKEYGLGLFKGRITIPVYDEVGEIVNVRRWSPSSKTAKMINLEGHGQPRLYPIKALEGNPVIITEGEMKALLLRQLGFNAVSPTGGAMTWVVDWGPLFADKDVFLVYDIDQPGLTGAHRAARAIHRFAASVKVVVLPLASEEYPTGGVDEYFLRAKFTAQDFAELLKDAEPWSSEEDSDPGEQEIHQLHLSQASLAKYHGQLVETEVVISAKDTAPYIVPRQYTVRCSQDREWCVACPQTERGEMPVTVNPQDPVILELINVTREGLHQGLRRAAGVPRNCEGCSFKVIESMNIEELRLIPQLSTSTATEEHVVRRSFYIGHGIETNVSYRIIAKVVAEPKTQYATLLVSEAKASVDSLSVFQLEDPDALKPFQPAEWTMAGIQARLDDLYSDLEANVTRIYQRRNLHLFYDLVYHSPLYITFQGQMVKGWVEGLVIGDSGQGKSETVSKLMKHYGVGEKVDSKGASVAGLLGGLQETAKRWFVSWGIIPLNDRRLVVLEEVKGMPPEVIAKLTDMRSSGIAELSKIEKTKTNARTRLIWISNARSDQQLAAYNFGVMAVKELIGSLEDVRRFDMVIAVASGDVGRDVLNMTEGERPHRRHMFTAALCRQGVLWAWSRKIDQVVFDDDATTAVLEAARRMGSTFTSLIPIVESADQRLKLARLSAGLAARTFSTDDGSVIRVRRCHVEYIEAFLTTLYSSSNLGYLDYSKLVRGELEVREPEEVMSAVRSMPYSRDLCRQLLDAAGFTVWDLMDWTEVDRDLARTFISLLIRKNAIKRGSGMYVKTPAFISLLKGIEPTLENKSLVESTGKDI
jgi:hypothetical protein